MISCSQCMEKLGENLICPHCGHDNREVQDVPYALKPGTHRTVGRKSDGTIVAVGFNKHGQCNIAN